MVHIHDVLIAGLGVLSPVVIALIAVAIRAGSMKKQVENNKQSIADVTKTVEAGFKKGSEERSKIYDLIRDLTQRHNEDLSSHKESVTPHSACAGHAVALEKISENMDKMAKNIEKIESNIFIGFLLSFYVLHMRWVHTIHSCLLFQVFPGSIFSGFQLACFFFPEFH